MAHGGHHGVHPVVVARELVRMYQEGANPTLFRNSYQTAQRHYRRAFGEEVRESGLDVWSYIKDTANGEYSENGKDSFVYATTWLVLGRREGKHDLFLSACTGDVLSPIDIVSPKGAVLARMPGSNFGLASGAYVWTAKSKFAQGYAKQAVETAMKEAEGRAQEQGYTVKLTFAEFEPEQERLGALQSVVQMAVPLVIADGRSMRAYYEQPGLEKGARSVPLIMGVGTAMQGVIMPVYEPVVMGLQTLKITQMPTELLVYGALRQMESYRTASYANQRQINRISERIVESLNPAVNKFTLMAPLADAAHLPMDPVMGR